MNHSTDDSSRVAAPLISDRMRELLTRIAKDQVAEQRSQAAALADIRGRLEGVEWVLQGVRDREIGQLMRRLESLEAGVHGFAERPAPDWAERLAERMDDVCEQVKPVADLPAMWADIGVVAESVDETLATIQSIADAARDNARRFDDLSRRLDALQSTLDAAVGRFGRLDDALVSLTGRAELLRGAVDGLGDCVDTALEGVGSRIDAATGRIDRRLTELGNRPFIDYSERIDALDERIRQAELRVAEAVSDVGRDLRARPDRDEVERAVSKVVSGVVGSVVGSVVDRAHARTDDRIAAIEESVLALAEALLRRTPDRDDGEEAPPKDQPPA